MKAPIVLFDVSTCRFTFYNKEEWAEALLSWREHLESYWETDTSYFSEYDLVERFFRGDVFIAEVPENLF